MHPRKECELTSHDERQREFPEKEAIHPAERELDELNLLSLKLLVEFGIDPAHEFLDSEDLALDPRLCEGVVILDPIQELAQTPKHIRLQMLQLFLREHIRGLGFHDLETTGGTREHDVERCREIIDPLHIARSRMADPPDVQNPFQALHRNQELYSKDQSEGHKSATCPPEEYPTFWMRGDWKNRLVGSVLGTSTLI